MRLGAKPIKEQKGDHARHGPECKDGVGVGLGGTGPLGLP